MSGRETRRPAALEIEVGSERGGGRGRGEEVSRSPVQISRRPRRLTDRRFRAEAARLIRAATATEIDNAEGGATFSPTNLPTAAAKTLFGGRERSAASHRPALSQRGLAKAAVRSAATFAHG